MFPGAIHIRVFAGSRGTSRATLRRRFFRASRRTDRSLAVLHAKESICGKRGISAASAAWKDDTGKIHCGTSTHTKKARSPYGERARECDASKCTVRRHGRCNADLGADRMRDQYSHSGRKTLTAEASSPHQSLRSQMLRKLIGSLGSPWLWSLMGPSPCLTTRGRPIYSVVPRIVKLLSSTMPFWITVTVGCTL